MKLNRMERWVVNNPLRVFEQRIQVAWMKKRHPPLSGGTCLELGCGRGAGARLILDAFQPSRLYALDLDIRMVQKAKAYLSPTEHEKITLLVGDAFSLPFASASLDAVFNFGVLHHVVNWRGALKEIARVLKTGGTFFLEELYPALYQNAITKRFLLHPEEDRFYRDDLWQELEEMKMPLRDALELKQLGVLGVAVKEC
jgi:ubiquinone/menaquinone biosynthesis C-methylase UbiE